MEKGGQYILALPCTSRLFLVLRNEIDIGRRIILFNTALAEYWTQDLLALISYQIHALANSFKSANYERGLDIILQPPPSHLCSFGVYDVGRRNRGSLQLIIAFSGFQTLNLLTNRIILFLAQNALVTATSWLHQVIFLPLRI